MLAMRRYIVVIVETVNQYVDLILTKIGWMV
jgi:hypothetical protein